ncbi:MAG: YkvA family protein [Bacteroidota bacterium]|jgi:uncharacterized membrane protein YkvA (DUF1232 family)
MNYELDDIDLKNNSPSNIEKEIREVEEGIWEKLERVGKKINFARDVKALYKYMRDRYVPWYRKSIVVGALIYFISPIDTIPDLAPLVGYLDDLGVITAVLKFLGSELIQYYER